MTRHRAIITAGITALILTLAAPAAQAGSLLSGYGGPGQGNQAILGATLLGGGAGGSRGGSGGPTTSTGTTPPAGSTASSTSKGAPTGSSGASRKRSGGGTAATPSRPHGSRAALPLAREAGDGRALGLSGADLLYMLLAFAGLVLTAAITRRLARQAH